MLRALIRSVALVAASNIIFLSAAMADTWPDKPVRIIVPYAPGGIADLVARLIAPLLQEGLGQSIVIENKTGASGSLGTAYVARSAPDGYTLLLGLAAPQTLNQFIYKVDYDGVKDFAPITLVNTNPMVLMVKASLPVTNVRELIAYAKAHPGKLNFSGAGGLTSYSGEIFKHMAGIDMVDVRYRGGAPAVTAAVSGETDLTFANYSDALPWMGSDRLRALALTGSKRFPQSPNLPTIAESGLPNYNVTGWSALFAPAGTPPERINKIAAILAKGFKRPEMREKMAKIGAEPGGGSPQELADLVRADANKWKSFVEKTGIKIGQ